MRPYPWNARDVPTAFLDYATGDGVTRDGDGVRAVRHDAGRKTASVRDLLDTARRAGIERVYLTGARPRSGWLVTEAQGWSTRRHHFDADTPVGRFTHDESGANVELRRASEWLGDGDYSPREARDAYALLVSVLRLDERHGGFGARQSVLASPSATGLDAWARTIRADDDVPQLDREHAELIRNTSPQHRQELFTITAHRAECDGCAPLVTAGKLPAVHYLDGRMMYAALTRELGCAPARMLTGRQALEHFAAAPYARARYLVRFRVPAGWQHAGLLMCKRDDGELWHAPNVPGYTGTTWADAAELVVAVKHGWHITFDAGLALTPGDPLGRWSRRMVGLWHKLGDGEAFRDATPLSRDLVRGALRAMLLFGIGAMHARETKGWRVSADPRDVPRDQLAEGTARREGRLYVWRADAPIVGRSALFLHPEWSSQVWARAHTRLLDAPTADRAVRAGVLHVPAEQVVAVYGDAIYLTEAPAWPDDGRTPGYFRTKGTAHNVTTPTTEDARRIVRDRAERPSK